MGSPASALAKGTMQAVSDYAPKVASWMRGYFGNMSHEANFEHPQWGAIDKALMSSAESYQRIHQQAMPSLEKPIKELWEGIKRDPALDAAHGHGKNTIGQIHADLSARQHPLVNYTTGLLGRSRAAAGQTIEEMSSHVPEEARLIAQRQALGPNNEYITPLFYQLYSMNDPKAWSHADSMLNIFSAMTHDKEMYWKQGKLEGVRSGTKADVQTAIAKLNKLNRQAGINQVAKLPKGVEKYIYEPPSRLERNVNKFVHASVAPFIAIPHIGTLFNLGSAPLSSLTKGLLSMRSQAFRDTIAQTGVLASTMHSIMDQAIRWETGATSKVVGHKAASLIGGLLHNPGFKQVRLTQLMFGGAVGYHAVQEWAEKAVSGNKRAIEELRLLHLDPAAIVQRGGQLTPSELQNAIYHFTNDRFFIDKTLNRALYSSSNKWLRTASMFHAFVSYQAAFMKNEISKLIRTGDILGFAQYAGTVGVAFPLVAPMMKSAEMLLRTGSPSQAGESIQDDYGTLLEGDGKERLFKYGELMSYLGAYGVYSHYLQAAEGHRLANQMLGPVLGTAATMGEDLVSGFKGDRRGNHNFEPLGRNLIRYGLPVVGAPAEHLLLPSKKRRGRR